MAVVGEQFSAGDQGSKKEFWESGFSTCQKCFKKNVTSEERCAGCRMNGDAYGTAVYTCQDCGWFTTFQYDDSGDRSSSYEAADRNFLQTMTEQQAFGQLSERV
mmetsp:Transcript_93876/g.140676  ORF Transcript_93876/g.140676 Transcript_93876/m.140676 type:complete len:104 (+) Transcript_93876:2-313(+)